MIRVKEENGVVKDMDSISELGQVVHQAVEVAYSSSHNDKYIEAVKWLNGLYDFLNGKFFENALSKPVITIQADTKCRAYGWFVLKEIWKLNKEDKGEVEINISANYLNRSAMEIAETMLHEMCHQYAYVNNIQDCSRTGTYHNKMFHKIATEHGLECEKVEKHGYASTKFMPLTAEIVKQYVGDTTLIYRDNIPKGKKIKNSSTRKYICRSCGNSVRATKSVNIMCVDCDEYMVEEW